ncbi:hypothetical protein NF699_09705 [Sphingomonadaceae bacterium OTU29LAMAA1]|nr:hypothetical protein NF699_09705 [Sphingomonadaceae bacterium OTU29LAMAA1]
MASQPTFAPYTPLRHAAPKPNIRIAYIAGDAATAIHRGMASIPAAVRESTLEELAIAGLTDELIAAGRELLSPAMYAAFLRWGETASHFVTRYETDEVGDARCEAAGEAGARLASIPAENIHDMLLKTRMLNSIEADCSDFGSMQRTQRLDPTVSKLALAIGSDLEQMSPVTALIEQIATLAWENSPPELMALAPDIGGIITSAFAAARENLGVDIPARPKLPKTLEGYSPFMRGPLVAWQRQYDRYLAADDALTSYDRNVHTPFFKQAEVDDTEARLVQEGYDELLEDTYGALATLLQLPAPSAAELAIKLTLYLQHAAWDLGCAKEIAQRMTADARRFARHGAFIQADGNLLAAFGGCRREMQNAYGTDAMSRDEEDAHFARLDAYETRLHDQPASTIEGAIAKLRIAFSRMNPDAWSNHAIMDPNSRDFREGLRMGGMFERIAWGAIEDLARISGINLTEQGA